MTWYSAGTASVRNGNKAVTIVGGDLINNLIQPGDAFLIRGGQPSEIARLISATQFELVNAWGGGDADGLAYSIQPTTDYQRVLATRLAAMVGDYQTVLDGPARGMFGDGSQATPGVRFLTDQDTGLFKYAANVLAIAAGGQLSALFDSDGLMARTRVRVGVGNPGTQGNIELLTTNIAPTPTRLVYGTDGTGYQFAISKNQGGVTTDMVYVLDNGNVGIGTSPSSTLEIRPKDGAGILSGLRLSNAAGGRSWLLQAGAPGVSNDVFSITNVPSGESPLRIDAGGNLLLGVPTGVLHTIAKPSADGIGIMAAFSNTLSKYAFFVQAGSNAAWGGSAAVGYMAASGSTNRSLNAAGTLNATGADYAEYIRKADGCGLIGKGDVCGVDRDGQLVRTWADAVRYVVKSTDPNLVGGDTWSSHLDPRPEEPVYVAPMYEGPSEPTEPAIGEDATDEEKRLYAAARLQYQVAAAAYQVAQSDQASKVAAAEAAHGAAMQDHAAALAAWEADLEAARQHVDRIAFCGQVPVNVDANTLSACEAALADGVAVYLVAVANGGGIGVTAIREDAMTLPLYMRRLGCVWAIRDGRPWLDVQHG